MPQTRARAARTLNIVVSSSQHEKEVDEDESARSSSQMTPTHMESNSHEASQTEQGEAE